jgi:hypothetical protein
MFTVIRETSDQTFTGQKYSCGEDMCKSRGAGNIIIDCNTLLVLEVKLFYRFNELDIDKA